MSRRGAVAEPAPEADELDRVTFAIPPFYFDVGVNAYDMLDALYP